MTTPEIDLSALHQLVHEVRLLRETMVENNRRDIAALEAITDRLRQTNDVLHRIHGRMGLGGR